MQFWPELSGVNASAIFPLKGSGAVFSGRRMLQISTLSACRVVLGALFCICRVMQPVPMLLDLL